MCSAQLPTSRWASCGHSAHHPIQNTKYIESTVSKHTRTSRRKTDPCIRAEKRPCAQVGRGADADFSAQQPGDRTIVEFLGTSTPHDHHSPPGGSTGS